jgi:putative intracellular protease/amidase
MPGLREFRQAGILRRSLPCEKDRLMRKKRKCFLFVFDGFADWEIAVAIAGLNQFTDFEIVVFSVDGQPVRSVGNVQVIPDRRLSDIPMDSIDLLLLPGGGAWEEGSCREIIPLVDETIHNGKVVGAICGATVLLGEEGYLNTIRHTSNTINYLLQMAPAYQGEDWYINKPCVSDLNIITANGTAAPEFAKEILMHFGLLDNNDALISWLHYFLPVEDVARKLQKTMTRLR